MHDSMREQLEGLELPDTSGSSTVAEAEARTAPKRARKQKAKPNPTKVSKKAASKVVEELVSIMVEEVTPQAPKAKKAPEPVQSGTAPELPRRDLLLLRLAGVSNNGAFGDLAIVAHLREDGTRFIRTRFDFTSKRKARWEMRILPVGIEHGPGWVSCFHNGKSAMAVHVFDLQIMGYSADRAE